MTEDDIYQDFTQAGIAFECLEHPAVHTVEESASIHEQLPAAHTKNLFLKDKSGQFWLVTLPSDKRADLKAFAALLGAGKFSFAKPDDMERLLKVTPGSVTPLAAANAEPGHVTLVFDASFREAERIAIHPLRNTATIALPFEALMSWLSGRGVSTAVVELP
ncbi:prolyl-tRNA synthetase associated domain-containing protein [Novosphingobium flavum]|uniref:Prolyl-tRNA synthetase associated domain-containing protein n=1 Tax=Novosphingobium aerophilum TaxID=2839843 RepID=A0A7X1F9P8_9SPHN|nr:prolyl-tRNA synthetase associated domain-containing protein [Novosphingobium aerophilum]MBC2652764.1 prolyl-tRNA synthetase associated domain-containing protein [Novosphingobium aerophilum]MBC2660845.1 prolyl-tRNA synthetase associated domain-containing protein [Novosphingobium aerophilum]